MGPLRVPLEDLSAPEKTAPRGPTPKAAVSAVTGDRLVAVATEGALRLEKGRSQRGRRTHSCRGPDLRQPLGTGHRVSRGPPAVSTRPSKPPPVALPSSFSSLKR